MHFAQTNAALHLCYPSEQLYEDQISIGVITVTKACCELVLQSSTEQ